MQAIVQWSLTGGLCHSSQFRGSPAETTSLSVLALICSRPCLASLHYSASVHPLLQQHQTHLSCYHLRHPAASTLTYHHVLLRYLQSVLRIYSFLLQVSVEAGVWFWDWVYLYSPG